MYIHFLLIMFSLPYTNPCCVNEQKTRKLHIKVAPVYIYFILARNVESGASIKPGECTEEYQEC